MKIVYIRKRLFKEEGGFSLPEMMVTIMLMLVVFFALYNIFDMSIRIFSYGSDKVEAVENARLGLEKMEREVRAAYPVDRGASAGRYLFFSRNGAVSNPPKAMPTTTQITFGNDFGGTLGKIGCGSPCEYITYKLDGTTLRRVNAASSSATGEPVVEFVEPDGLMFTYLRSDGNALTASELSDVNNENLITAVRISLNIRVEGGNQDGTQTLTTDVDLRNRE